MKRSNCPICVSDDFSQIEYRPTVPALLNRFSDTPSQAGSACRGILDLVGCKGCGFVWNRQFDPANVSYDVRYENAGTHSNTFRLHAEHVADRILAKLDGAPFDVLEIGCGQGEFLRILAARAGSRMRSAVGFDPAARSSGVAEDARIQIHRAYFDAESARALTRTPNVIIARHVIDQVPYPLTTLSAARDCSSADAKIFIETPNFRWTLERAEIQDLYYEHCSLFDAVSLPYALGKAGFTPLGIEPVFGGQYLLAEAYAAGDARNDARSAEGGVHFPDLRGAREKFVENWVEQCRGKRTVVWGAGGKGVTFCTLIDLERNRIAAIVDLNPAKQGLYLPLSGHRVIAPAELKDLCPELIVLMNPNYLGEVSGMLDAMELKCQLAILNAG